MLTQSFQAKFTKILRSLEQYTKTDMVYVAREGFWSLFNQGIGTLCSFLVVVILANVLSKESLGQYRFILTTVSLLTLFTLPGIGTSLLRSVARENTINLNQIAITKIKWSLISSAFAILGFLYYFYKGNSLLSYSLLIIAVFLPLVEALYIYVGYFKGKQDFKTVAMYDSGSRIFQAIFLVIAALLIKSVVALIAAFFIGQFLARSFFYLRTLNHINNQKSEIKINTLDDTISYGKHLSLVNIFGALRGNLDKLLIWHFLGAAPLAIYYIALSIPNNLVLLFNVIPRIALPKFSKKIWSSGEEDEIFRKVLLFFTLLLVPAVLYAFLAPFIIPILFSGYNASIFPTVVLSSLIVLFPVIAIIEHVLYAQKSVKKVLFLQVVELIIFIGSFFLLYKNLGINGVAIAIVISTAASSLVGLFFLKFRRSPQS